MGAVWAATNTQTGKAFALKVLKASAAVKPQMRQRFLREARAATAVEHPSIVQVYAVLELPDATPVIVMELLHGETLAARLARQATIPIAELARILLPVCSAVGTAHQIGIVHRDLKPENIFLAESGSDTARQVKVLDFGIAKLTASDGAAARSTGITGTGTGVMLGTPLYMSPEQLFGEKDVDHRADIWSIGVILYEALAGVPPTAADNVGQILKIVTTNAIIPLAEKVPGLPERVTSLVGHMLQHDRRRRPEDLREVCRVLETFCDDAVQAFGAPAPPPSLAEDMSIEPTGVAPGRQLAVPAPHNPRKRSTMFMQAAVVALAGALGVVGWRLAAATRQAPEAQVSASGSSGMSALAARSASAPEATAVPTVTEPTVAMSAEAALGSAEAPSAPPVHVAAEDAGPRKGHLPPGPRSLTTVSGKGVSTAKPPQPDESVDPGSYY